MKVAISAGEAEGAEVEDDFSYPYQPASEEEQADDPHGDTGERTGFYQ